MGIFSKKTEEKAKETVVEDIATKKVVEKKSLKQSSKKNDDVTSTTGAYGTIIAPIVTEKSHNMVSEHKYTFRVAKTVSKPIVKKIIEEMYGVRVENINIIITKPKRRTVKQDRGYQKLYKKAIVTVNSEDHIAVFEGV